MPITEWSMDEAALASTIEPLGLNPETSFTDDKFARTGHDDPGFLDAAISTAQRENLTYQLGDEAIAQLHRGGDPRKLDPNFNPYSYIKQNFTKEMLEEFKTEISDGMFDEAISPEHVQWKVSELRKEMDLIKNMEGSMAGTLVGGLVGGLTDPTSYIPLLGQANRASRIVRMGRLAMATAAVVGAQEVGLNATQDYRTWKESLMNVGVGAVFAGGIGAFARGFHPDHPMHPGNPRNPHAPLADESGLVTRVAGADEYTIGPSSAGAAEALRDAPELLRGNKWFQKPVDAVVGKFLDGTIAGRALQWSSAEARGIISTVIETGGAITRQAKDGVRRVFSAELLRNDYMARWFQEPMLHLDRKFTEINRGLGELGHSKIAPEDFQNAFRASLDEDYSDILPGLQSKYGQEGAALIKSKLDEVAEQVHTVNKEVEAKLIERGELRDNVKVGKLRDEIKTIGQKRDAELGALRQSIADLKEAHKQELSSITGAANKDARVEAKRRHNAELDALKGKEKEIREAHVTDHLHEELDKQMRMAEPMGREYRYAQLWEKSAILRNPEEFKRFLLDVLAEKPDEDWLMSAYGLSRGELADLKATNPEKHLEVMREWAGDTKYFHLQRLEAAQEAAERSLKDAQLDFAMLADSLGVVRDKIGALELSEARKYRDVFHSRVEEAHAKREQIATERRTVQAAIQAAMQRQFDEASSLITRQADVGATNWKSLMRAEKAKARAEKAGNADDLSKAIERTGEAEKAAKVDPLEAPKAPAAETTADLAKLQERYNQLNKQLAREDRRVARIEAARDRFEAAHAEVETKLNNARSARDDVKDMLAQARKDLRAAEKTDAQIRKELRQVAKSKGLDEAIDDITNRMMLMGENPIKVIDRVVGVDEQLAKSGRMKARRLELTPEQKRWAQREGFLRDDVVGILGLQYKQLAGHMALREALDIGSHEGAMFNSWGAVRQRIVDDYMRKRTDVLTAKQRAAADPNLSAKERAAIEKLNEGKATSKLNAEMDRALSDLETAKARLLGMEDAGIEKDSWVYWLSRKARQASYLRYGAAFGIGSLTDIGTSALQHRVIPMMLQHFGPALKEAFGNVPKSQLRALVNSSEIAMHGMMAATRTGDDDLLRVGGIGMDGTMKKRITSQVDRAGHHLTNTIAMVSGLPQWTRFMKIMNGLALSHKIRDQVLGFASLSQKDRAMLAMHGIGEFEAKRMEKFIREFGDDPKAADWDPNLDKWMATAEGREAARDYRMAVQRGMNWAVVTPGLGDTPKIMDKWYGKLWLQFQTFAFAFVTRYMAPMLQRAAHFQDIQAASSFAWLMATAAMVVTLRDGLKGKDPFGDDGRWNAKSWEDPQKAFQHSFDIVDRSGMFGYMSPYLSAGTQLVGLSGASRFARNSALENIGGPNLQLLGDISRFAGAASEGDGAQIGKTALRLAPGAALLRMFEHLYE